MLRISLAASGEEVVALDAGKFEAVVEEYGSTVACLKRYLAQKHFPKRFSRFQLRILREGSSSEMEDEESISTPLDLQLILMNHLPPDEERDGSFVESCRAGRVDEVVENLKAQHNPDVVSGGRAALTRAAANGREEVARLLLEAGADTEWKESFQRTALHVAAQTGYSEVVRILLEFGADMEAGDCDGSTPLHLAAAFGHTAVAQLLLDSGADKEAEDIYCRRPLHLAAEEDFIDVVQLLVEAGVDKNALDKRGRTAAQRASQKARSKRIGPVTRARLTRLLQLLQDDKRRRRSLKFQAKIARSYISRVSAKPCAVKRRHRVG